MTLDNDVLMVRGESAGEQEKVKFRVEPPYGSFQRAANLP